MRKVVLIFGLLLLFVCLSQQRRGMDIIPESYENANINQSIYYFDQQRLDHFVVSPPTVWKQRYFVFDQYFDNKTGPLFLYICGESRCKGIPQTRQFPVEAAQQFKGIVITLEHRFYGESQPFGQSEDSYSLENLKYLSHFQALEDLAYFIGYLKHNNLHGVTPDTPVITIGGSYPGALSAWFRYKYKHLTIGALASSAVVNAIRDFQHYDYQISLSTEMVGEWCTQGIQSLNAYVESQLADPDTNFRMKKDFNALMLSDDEFLEMIADDYAGMVQYGNTSGLCNYYITRNSTNAQQLLRFQEMDPSSKFPSSFAYLKNTSYDIDKNGRQWTYQTCTFFGWYQTANKVTPMRSPKVDIEYFHRMCTYVFGTDYWPQTNETNLIMGGVDMRVDNIVFTNGVQDPWKWASITQDEGNMKAYVADCDDCAHCVDLSTPSESLPTQVTQIQQKVFNHFNDWIIQYWSNKTQKSTEQQQSSEQIKIESRSFLSLQE